MYSYNIAYSDYVLYNLAFFIENLKIQRKRRYTNTGLEDVLLVDKYYEEIEQFYEEIIKFIEDKLSTGMLGVIQEKTEKYYIKKIVLDIRSYTLVLKCKQYLQEKVIIIEDIIIQN